MARQLPVVPCLWIWVALHLQLQDRGSFGCLEEERIGLLNLKESFPNDSALSSWEGAGSDCCSWERVKCDGDTKRVSQLSLNATRRKCSEWFLNGSFVLPFQELRVLDLSSNCINGLFDMPLLKNLRVLDLSYNRFGRIPSLGALTLGKLEVLDLSYASSVSSIPPPIGVIPLSIGALTSLKALSFHRSGVHGPLPAKGLCNLRNLEELDLSRNQLEGNIPLCFSNLTSLRLLQVSENNFHGAIPPSLFPSLQSLEYVSLSYCHFGGSLSLSSFSNSSKLEVFELESYNSHLRIEIENPPWFPPFQLKISRLSNCTLDEPSRAIPTFLFSQSELRILDLGHNGMRGKFPSWILANNTRLEFLSLMNNSLTGHLSFASDAKCIHLYWCDISINSVNGHLPLNIGSVLPNLLFLNISGNDFHGSIPSSIGDMRKLYSLDFSNNSFSGEIPEHLVMGCVSLTFLKLSNNNLHGRMLPMGSNLTDLWYLDLENNHFTGGISKGLLSSSGLSLLDISDNHISGELPNWIGNLSALMSLVLSRNSLEGTIPEGFCKSSSLRFLDLSWNKLGPTFPPCTNLSSLKYLHLQGNEFSGPIPDVLCRSQSLLTLDVRENKFSGTIPGWIGLLPNLRILLLKGNMFEGSIPMVICQLHRISIMDLSHNNLSGSIPSCLADIGFGRGGKFDGTFTPTKLGWTTYRSLRTYSHVNRLKVYQYTVGRYLSTDEMEEVEFMTKSRFESYKGNILYFMSGLDLSNNRLTGSIPQELGYLSGIHSLNLSHNCLVGSIPVTFSELTEIESLDLSYNRLGGEIPLQLIELNFLSVFSVAHNNLSGRTPERKAQFATFGEGSYSGNSLLCGWPLERRCRSNREDDGEDGDDDDDSFYLIVFGSFAGSFMVAFIGVVSFLYLFPMRVPCL